MRAVHVRVARQRLIAAWCVALLVLVQLAVPLSGPLAAQDRTRATNLGALLSGRKAPVDGELRDLGARIDALARTRDADDIAPLLTRARVALAEARAATAAGERKAAARARQLAWAALTLASRRVALRTSERYRQLAERRAARAEAALAAERAALEVVRAKRSEGTQ